RGSEPQRQGQVGTGGDPLDERRAGHEQRYWDKRVDLKDSPASVRVQGVQYIISAEESAFPFRGFGGQDFFIKFHSGRLVHSTNLGLNGEIPDGYRKHLPDNAEFVSRGEFRQLVVEGLKDQVKEPVRPIPYDSLVDATDMGTVKRFFQEGDAIREVIIV